MLLFLKKKKKKANNLAGPRRQKETRMKEVRRDVMYNYVFI